MIDDEIRELEQRLAEGDTSARPRLAEILLRSGRSVAPLMEDTGIQDPGLATAAGELDVSSYERLVADLGQLDAAGIVAGLAGGPKYAARLAVYTHASGERRALLARREDTRIWLALEPEPAEENTRENFTMWDRSAWGRASWRRDHRRARAPLPLVFTVRNLGLAIRALFAAVDPMAPATLRAEVKTTEDRAANSVFTTTRWAHGAMHAELTEATDYEHPAMESADRTAWSTAGGLPGDTQVSFVIEHASTIARFEMRGPKPEADALLAGWGTRLLALAGPNLRVKESELAPDAWVARARMLDLGAFVFDQRRWWTLVPDMVVAQDDASHFAFVFGGGIDDESVARLWIEPIGPVPALLHSVRFSADHPASITPVDALPELGALVESLLGAPLPAEPEATRQPWPTHRQHRFRLGLWVIREWRETGSDGTTKVRMRFQEESGGAWALFLELEARKNGFGRAWINLLGAPESTRIPEESVRAWMLAKGWTMNEKHRHARRPPLPS